jgi:hypothetical protein
MAASVTAETSSFLAGEIGQFVDALDGDQRRIHVEADQAEIGQFCGRPGDEGPVEFFGFDQRDQRIEFGVRLAPFRQTTCGGRGSTVLAPVAATMRSSRKVGRAPPWMTRFMMSIQTDGLVSV